MGPIWTGSSTRSMICSSLSFSKGIEMAKDIPADRPPPPPPPPPDNSVKSKAAAAAEKSIGTVRDNVNAVKDLAKLQAKITMHDVKDTASKAANWASDNKDKAEKAAMIGVAGIALYMGPTLAADNIANSAEAKQRLETVSAQGVKGTAEKAEHACQQPPSPARPVQEVVGPARPPTPDKRDPFGAMKLANEVMEEAEPVQRKKEDGLEDTKLRLS